MTSRKLTFNQLEPGLLTKEGLIVRTGKAGTDKVFKDSDFIKFFEIQDAHYGQCYRSIKNGEEFEILHEIGTKKYEAIIFKLIRERDDCRSAAENVS